MKELLNLFFAFFRIGGMTFGGGLTMLPMLKYELVDQRGWIDEDTLLECYAIGQCTPGIIAVNTATFIGYRRKGIIGGGNLDNYIYNLVHETIDFRFVFVSDFQRKFRCFRDNIGAVWGDFYLTTRDNRAFVMVGLHVVFCS